MLLLLPVPTPSQVSVHNMGVRASCAHARGRGVSSHTTRDWESAGSGGIPGSSGAWGLCWGQAALLTYWAGAGEAIAGVGV